MNSMIFWMLGYFIKGNDKIKVYYLEDKIFGG